MRIAAFLLAASLPALAQSPAEFRSHAPIATRGSGALQQLELPREVYRDARRDLGDVRVFNAAGESVPIAWAGPPHVELESAPPVELPIFPVSTLETVGGKGAEVSIRTADGTLVSVRGHATPQAKARPAAYLLDASQESEPVRALVFDWQAGPGTEVVNVRIDASDDLKSWSRIAASPLVRIESAGRTLSQPRVDFTPRRAKYFRVSWDAPAFTVAHVKAEHEPRGKPVPRHVQAATGTVGKEGEITYDLGARLPVQAFRLVPSQENAVVSAAVSAREEPEGPWRLVANASFYRFKRESSEPAPVPGTVVIRRKDDDSEARSPLLEIGTLRARYWMVKLAPGSSGGPPPALETEWSGARLVFVAQGEGSFNLAFGNLGATSTALPIASVIPKYEKGAEVQLPEANAGAVTAGPPPTRWEAVVGSLNPRRIVLWAILAGGVVLLGVMAWRLRKQMR